MAMSVAEDLEYNEFYRALQTRYQALYDRAQDECWLVCIPKSSSLPPTSQIGASFVEAHLLEPSKLYRDEYATLVNGRRHYWKLEDSILYCKEQGHSVRVLSEELAYNKTYKQYRMFIISQPLIKKVTTSRRESSPLTGATKEDLLIPRKSLPEHLHLLHCFAKSKEILVEVDRRLDMFRDNYMVLEGFLSDAARRLEGLSKLAFQSYVTEHPTDIRLQDRRVKESVWLATENYVMSKVHTQVYPKVCSKFKKEDEFFRERCHELRGSLVPSAVGIPSDYYCHYNGTIDEFNRLVDYKSPLEKLYCLREALDCIQKDVKMHFKKTLRVGDPAPLPSDDLVALLATILVQASLKTFPSDVYYTESFHWPFSDGDKLSYVLVTVRTAFEYIRGQEVQKFLTSRKPERQQTNTQQQQQQQQTHHRPSPSTNHRASPSLPPSLLELHEHKPPQLDDTLKRLKELKVKGDQLERQSMRGNGRGEQNNSMGPFFSHLLEMDGKVSSRDKS